MATYNCVDVSEHNGDIDWIAAKADGVEYALIRCGFGRDYESQDDKYFDINMQNALEAGIKVGAYFYSYAQSEDAAASEATHCLRLIEPYRDKLSLPVFYDVEESNIEDYVEDTIPVFTRILKDAGYNVGVYATGYWFTHCLQYVAIDYLWVAYWGNDDGVPHSKPEFCDIWQYTSKGYVDGIGARCVDCDILYNTEMRALIDDPKPEPTPEPPIDPVTIELDVLKRGCTGGQVNTLKALLNEYGFADNMPLDSDFDWDTEQAVIAYQKKYGLKADGIVGLQTWTLLLK